MKENENKTKRFWEYTKEEYENKINELRNSKHSLSFLPFFISLRILEFLHKLS